MHKRKANPTRSLWSVLIPFLFENGDLLEMGNYRPLCLQETADKILSAILTDQVHEAAAEPRAKL